VKWQATISKSMTPIESKVGNHRNYMPNADGLF